MPDRDSPISFVKCGAVQWVTGTVGAGAPDLETLGQVFKPGEELKHSETETHELFHWAAKFAWIFGCI